MLITNHVAAGAVVGAVAPGPVSAFAVGLASHFAMDALPHWGEVDYDSFLRVAVPDGLVGLGVLAWLARSAPPTRRVTVLAGMLGACLPDADKPGQLFVGRSPFPDWVDRWHAEIQREAPHRMPRELTVAAAGLAAAGWLVKRGGRRRSTT